MKFMSILLSEGRKEDLKKRYSSKFQDYPDTLDFILGISDLQDSNHKYTDFVLKNLHPNSSTDEIEDAIELVKDFEQFSNKLEIKDINQYKSFEQLQDAVIDLKQVKGPKPESEKIYEDSTFVVLKPKNEEASCKYGSRTKWCVTSKGSGHFQRYTSGDQELYFIINKKNSTNDYYSKVAVHVDSGGRFTYWDSQDNRMDIKEIKILEYAFPELMKSIKDDYDSKSISRAKRFTNEVFDSYSSGEYASKNNFLNRKFDLEVHVEGFENVDEMDGHAMAQVAIELISETKQSLLDVYDIFITYRPNESKQIITSFRFEGVDPLESWDYVDLGLENLDIEVTFKMSESASETARGIRIYLATRVLDYISKNQKLIEKVVGSPNVFTPTYGYTFGKNKGWVKKLVDYLDSGKIGTKLDFLTDVGYIEKVKKDGKTMFRKSKGGFLYNPRELRGQHSSFFAAAKNAGILGYRKVGKEYFLTKGPNFDAFKSGELRAL